MPRWAPPRLAPSAETSASCRKQAAVLAVVVPEAAQKEGLSSEALGSTSGAAEPAAGTPDGGSALGAGRGVMCRRALSDPSARLAPLGHEALCKTQGGRCWPSPSSLWNWFVWLFLTVKKPRWLL